MIPRKFALARQHRNPNQPKPPPEMGMFAVSAEIFVAAMLLAIGMHFLIVATEPDVVAWVAFGLIVLALFDAARRLINIVAGRAPA